MTASALWQDNTYGTLASGIAVGDTSIALTTGHGARFPVVTSGTNFMYATLLNSNNVLEEIHITAHAASSDTLTVSRGANGTTAKVWSSGDRIEVRLNSEWLNNPYALTLSAGPGTVAAPSFYLNGNTGSGLYEIGANNWGLAISGVNLLNFSSAALVVNGTLEITSVSQHDAGLKTGSGLLATTSGVATTLFNIGTKIGAYLVFAGVDSGAMNAYGAVALVLCEGTIANASITTLIAGGGIALSLTGAGNVQVTQTAGSFNVKFNYTLLKAA